MLVLNTKVIDLFSDEPLACASRKRHHIVYNNLEAIRLDTVRKESEKFEDARPALIEDKIVRYTRE